MRRRWIPLCVLAVIAACSAPDDVALVESEQIDASSTTTAESDPPTPTTGVVTEPTFTLPEPPSSAPPSAPSSGPPASTSVPAPDLPVPDECVPLPDDAPSLLVTTDDGTVYQVGPGGTQQVADSDGLLAPIGSAWRAAGGTLWVALGPGVSLGRLDAGTYTESVSGNVSLQHVGEIDGDPVALWFDLGGQPGAEQGRIVLEHPDGTQDEVGPAFTPNGSVSVGNVGADTVLITRLVDGEPRFEYLGPDGQPAHDDWFNPTDRPAAGDVARSSAAVSADGNVLIWTEQPAGLGSSGGPLELVIGRTSGPEIQERVTLATPGEAQTTGDFDGRWALASLSDGVDSTRTVLVDTKASTPEAIVPCVPVGSATIDRAGGGGESPPTTPPTSSAPTTESPTTTIAESPPGTPPGTTPSSQVGGDPIDP